MTAGFCARGFTPVAAVESDRFAARTYAANFGDHVFACPIEKVGVARLGSGLRWHGVGIDGEPLTFDTPKIDVLIGGPPCQGFSPLGRMVAREFSDPRNRLWQHYVRLLDIIAPRLFVIENVPELLKSEEFAALLCRLDQFDPQPQIVSGVLNAKHFGVPQSRRRAIVIGSRLGQICLPEPLSGEKSVRDAIGDLPIEPNGANWHVARNPWPISLERYQTIPPGGNRFDLIAKRPDLTPPCWIKKTAGSTDVFGRMLWDAPAPTIRTEFFKPEKGRYLHPEAHRSITIREAARLQTFRDDFVFSGSNLQVAKQIGNAVPVLFAAEIASHLRVFLENPGAQNRHVEADVDQRRRNQRSSQLNAARDYWPAEQSSTQMRPTPSSPAVSQRMSVVKRRDTACELAVRKQLYARGLRYRIDASPIPGARIRADILFRSARVAIFIDGCFWHGCDCKLPRPRANADWWATKLLTNQNRDRRVNDKLMDADWRVLRFWEHENATDVAQVIVSAVRRIE